MKTLRAALLCLPFLVACGDDGPRAADYEGTWLITSMTVPAEVGTMTVTRDGSPTSLRGDVVIAPTGDATASMHVRQIPLEDGVPTAGVMSAAMALEVEEGRWIVREDGGQATVFTSALHEGEHLILTLDAEDPRTTAENPPLEVMAMKATPWTTASVGVWDLVMMATPGGDMIANMCMVVAPGERWAKVQMMVAIDGHLIFERSMVMAGYADPLCTELVAMEMSVQRGLAEEEGGNVLRLWAYEDERGEQLTFSLTMEQVMTLTRTACLPMPGCAADGPTTVVVAPR